jgi:hypothetical protein
MYPIILVFFKSLGYAFHRLPLLSQLLNNDVIEDFQTINKESLVEYNKILPQDSFSLNYYNVNSKDCFHL